MSELVGQVVSRLRMPKEQQVVLFVKLLDPPASLGFTRGYWKEADVKPIDPHRMRAEWYVAPGGNVLVDSLHRFESYEDAHAAR